MKKIILSLGILFLPCLAAASGNITISAAHVNGNVLQIVSSDTATGIQTNSASLINSNLGCTLTTVQTNSKIVVMAFARAQIETIGNGISLNLHRASPSVNLLSNNWVSDIATSVNTYKFPSIFAVDSPGATAGTVETYTLQFLSPNTNPVDINGEQYMICEEVAQ